MTRARILALLILLLAFPPGCARNAPGDDHGHDHAAGESDDHPDDHGHAHGEGESWAVTSWGEHFEIFAEADPLTVGETANSHTHVTVLDGFQALLEGKVSAVLRRPGLADQVFTQNAALRPGIFDIAITPESEGPFDVLFVVDAGGVTEEIPCGEVIVGTAGHPGELVSRAPEPDGEVISFLKEQQWRMDFRTEWSARSTIRESIRGTAQLKPAAGGEMLLTASIDAIVRSSPWPYVGLSVSTGSTVFSLGARGSQGKTLGELEAFVTQKRGEMELAKSRVARLEGLLAVEAVSDAEVARARSELETLEAQYESARRQLRSGEGAGKGAGASVDVNAPFAGEVAAVLVMPGEAVSAGQVLGRVVRVDPVWVDVHVAPQDADRVAKGIEGIWVRPIGADDAVFYESAKLVSLSPEVDAKTGRVECLIEIEQGDRRLRIGSAAEAEILVPATRAGIVLPSTAVLDDHGTSVVYAQVDGENFVRRDVNVVGREGNKLLVEGIEPGKRIVTDGGASIRRASLIGAGVGHGHVH
ncbi:MAG: efflux RND transporter periplasmic adaptor subunit [Gemmatimonadetes bacterium]|nr:efflux RND transporter periplasmic adaptor subunit [Gemmatimonadota bacterium]